MSFPADFLWGVASSAFGYAQRFSPDAVEPETLRGIRVAGAAWPAAVARSNRLPVS